MLYGDRLVAFSTALSDHTACWLSTVWVSGLGGLVSPLVYKSAFMEWVAALGGCGKKRSLYVPSPWAWRSGCGRCSADGVPGLRLYIWCGCMVSTETT